MPAFLNDGNSEKEIARQSINHRTELTILLALFLISTWNEFNLL